MLSLCSISKGCKPYLTEAGPEIINHLCDMRINEAAFLINTQPEPQRYLEMTEFVRDGLMVLIGVPSQTFQFEKVGHSLIDARYRDSLIDSSHWSSITNLSIFVDSFLCWQCSFTKWNCSSSYSKLFHWLTLSGFSSVLARSMFPRQFDWVVVHRSRYKKAWLSWRKLAPIISVWTNSQRAKGIRLLYEVVWWELSLPDWKHVCRNTGNLWLQYKVCVLVLFVALAFKRLQLQENHILSFQFLVSKVFWI